MKKFMISCIALAFATSCKKDYTCVCTNVDTNNGKTETTVDTYSAKSKKKDAEAWCESLPKATVSFAGAPTTSSGNTTCELK